MYVLCFPGSISDGFEDCYGFVLVRTLFERKKNIVLLRFIHEYSVYIIGMPSVMVGSNAFRIPSVILLGTLSVLFTEHLRLCSGI